MELSRPVGSVSTVNRQLWERVHTYFVGKRNTKQLTWIIKRPCSTTHSSYNNKTDSQSFSSEFRNAIIAWPNICHNHSPNIDIKQWSSDERSSKNRTLNYKQTQHEATWLINCWLGRFFLKRKHIQSFSQNKKQKHPKSSITPPFWKTQCYNFDLLITKAYRFLVGGFNPFEILVQLDHFPK